MRKRDTGSPRDRTRAQLVQVAEKLLATQGPDAVTTRSVALAAGVQAPAIYRLFGDKNGLLGAVVEHGFASYLARKEAGAVRYVPHEQARRHLGLPAR